MLRVDVLRPLQEDQVAESLDLPFRLRDFSESQIERRVDQSHILLDFGDGTPGECLENHALGGNDRNKQKLAPLRIGFTFKSPVRNQMFELLSH